MKKQFANKKELDAWVEENFPVKKENVFTMPEVADEKENVFTMPEVADEKEIANKLLEAGYDLDDLTENGEGYEVDGHTNNGWTEVYKEDVKWMESAGYDMSKVRVK